MALKDCIAKMGKLVSPEDVAKLEQYLADGLTDEQAVRKLRIEAHENVIELAIKASEQGAELKPSAKAEVIKTELFTLTQIRADRVKVQGRLIELMDELKDIGWLEQYIQTGDDLGGDSVVDRARPDLIDSPDFVALREAELAAKNEFAEENDRFTTYALARGKGVQDLEAPADTEATRQLSKFLEAALMRFQMEEEGQAILDDMEESNVSPVEVSEYFWSFTYPRLNAKTQKKFQRMLKGLGYQPGDLIFEDETGKEMTADSWEEIGEFVGEDLPTVSYLEGTERGYVALMEWANVQGQKAETAGPQAGALSELEKLAPGSGVLQMTLTEDIKAFHAKLIGRISDLERRTIDLDDPAVQRLDAARAKWRSAEDAVKRWISAREGLTHAPIDLDDDAAVLNILGAMFFDPEQGPRLRDPEKGIWGLYGNTPHELLTRFRELQGRKRGIAEESGTLMDQDEALARRQGMMAMGKKRPGDDGVFKQEGRGSIRFFDRQGAIIRLNASRDLSTFLHESGHLYLGLMGDLAARENAPAQVKRDFGKILVYLGVKDRSEIGTDQHERFAKAFELYLEEGKAPDPGLQTAFNAFRSWLMNIYRGKRRAAYFEGIELNDDLRGVFDRLIATDDAIAQAELSQEYAALYASAEQMGVSDEVWSVYKNRMIRAHQEAVDAETAKQLRYMQRQAQNWWKSELAKVRAEVETEVHDMSVYKALTLLQRGTNPDGSASTISPFKLDRDDLIERYGKDFLKRLPGRGRANLYAVEGGVDLDSAALMFGFESGNVMIEELLKAPKMESYIRSESLARMNEIHSDPLVDGTLADGAIVHVHNEARAQMLAAELRELRKAMREDRPIVAATKKQMTREQREAMESQRATLPDKEELSVIKATAKRLIAGMLVRHVNPNKYLVAETKAGNASRRAFERKDFYTAYQERRKQLVAHEMYREAQRAKTEASRTQKYLRKYETRKEQRKIGRSDLLQEILAMIEGIDLRRQSLAQVDRNTALQTIAEQINDGIMVAPEALAKDLYTVRLDPNGNEVVVLNPTWGKSWQDMSVEELRGVRDIVKQLEMQAKRDVAILVAGEQKIVQEEIDAVAESIVENGEKVPAQVTSKTKGQQLKRESGQGLSFGLRPPALARILDQAEWGEVTKRIIVVMRRAVTTKLYPMLHKAQTDVEALYAKHYTVAERRKMSTKTGGKVAEFDEEWSHADRLALGMNWGNEGNRRAVRQGITFEDKEAFPEAGIQAILNSLTARDWAFIQDYWDYLDTYRQPLFDAERRRRGIAPERIEPAPFTVQTSDGQTVTLRGGYMPLKYAKELEGGTTGAPVNQAQEMFTEMSNGLWISAGTRAGATHNRVKNHKKVVRIQNGMRVPEIHLREIIRDIAIGDEVHLIKRILDSKEVDKAIKKTGNGNLKRALDLWLIDAALGELPAEDFTARIAIWGRTTFVKSKLGLNWLTAELQWTGFFQSAAIIGPHYQLYGIAMTAKNILGSYRHVLNTSPAMALRYNFSIGKLKESGGGAFDKDVMDASVAAESLFGASVPTAGAAFWRTWGKVIMFPIMLAQSVVDVSTWIGAQQRGLVKLGLSEAEANEYADAMVDQAQTSGFFSERSGIERGTTSKRVQNQWIRIWTTLLAYMMAKLGNSYESYQTLGRTRRREAAAGAPLRGVASKPTLVAAMKLAGAVVLMHTMEAMLSNKIYDRFGPDGDDPDDEDDSLAEWAAWISWETLMSAVSGVPFVREIPQARFRGGNTPIGSIAHGLLDLSVQTEQGEIDKAWLRAMNEVVSYASSGRWPSSSTFRMGETFVAEFLQGEDRPFTEYFTGRRETEDPAMLGPRR